MPFALRLSRLPGGLHGAVGRALHDPSECEVAIEAIERHLATDRSPDLLIALAALTYREAEALVLSRIEAASQRALALIEEALVAGARRTREIDALKACCLASIAKERAREAMIVGRIAKGCARAHEVVDLAHRVLRREDDDALATALLKRAS